MLIIILIQSCASHILKKNDLQKNNFLGKVKSVKQVFDGFDKELDSVESFIVVKYNKLGYITVTEIHQHDGSIEYNSFKLDPKNDIIEQREYNTDKELVAIYTYIHKYTKKGEKIKTKKLDENGQLISKINFSKEKNIIIIDSENYLKDDYLNYRTVEKLEAQHYHLLEYSIYKLEGELDYKTQYKCNNQGYPVEMTTYGTKGEILSEATIKYTLDQYKNWIKSTYYEQGKPTSVTKREIAYY